MGRLTQGESLGRAAGGVAAAAAEARGGACGWRREVASRTSACWGGL